MRDLNQKIDFNSVFDQGEQLDQAIAMSTLLAIKRHKALDQSIVIWQDERPTTVPAADIDLKKWSLPDNACHMD